MFKFCALCNVHTLHPLQFAHFAPFGVSTLCTPCDARSLHPLQYAPQHSKGCSCYVWQQARAGQIVTALYSSADDGCIVWCLTQQRHTHCLPAFGQLPDQRWQCVQGRGHAPIFLEHERLLECWPLAHRLRNPHSTSLLQVLHSTAATAFGLGAPELTFSEGQFWLAVSRLWSLPLFISTARAAP